SLVAWLPAPANAGQCDYTGFDKPCAVQDGVYRALVPEGAGPFPVMVYLYGSGGQSASVTNHPLFDAAVVQRGYALIVPAALDMDYRRDLRLSGWSLRHEPGGRRDEALFISRVIDDVGRRFPIDRDRVLLAGQSRGAFLVWEIACHAPDLAAAFAAHAGGYLGNMPEECERPVRFLDSHGLADAIVPFAGEPVVSGGITMATPERSLDTLARTNRCAEAEPEDAGSRLGLRRKHWSGCAPGASLDLMLHDGGHVMPVDWFRAVLDWFEEPPEAAPEVAPLTLLPGARLPGRFKPVPPAGPAPAVTEPGAGRRLQAPGRSRNSSQ
ncbi:MAG: alpha/beta hydrolase family esterase, partial [Paracoccaceae bacterium]